MMTTDKVRILGVTMGNLYFFLKPRYVGFKKLQNGG